VTFGRGGRRIRERDGTRELFDKEGWWAVWIGLAIVVVAVLLFESGNSNLQCC
jgi:hypothetical protein